MRRQRRARCPALPAAALDAAYCEAALDGLLSGGTVGVVARSGGRCVGVLCGHATGGYAVLPADGAGIDPSLSDATPILVRLYAELAPMLLAAGAVGYYGTHINWAPLGEAFIDLAFGRTSIYASQPARPARRDPDIDVRIGTADDLDTIAELSHIEMVQRFAPPVYAPPHPCRIDDVRAHPRALLADDAEHLLARIERVDVGLLTLERRSPAPRMCPAREPYIGPTATRPSARGRGVGTALVEAALEWAFEESHESVSVDFQPANQFSRPFWLGAGFVPTGYGVARHVDASYASGPQQLLRS